MTALAILLLIVLGLILMVLEISVLMGSIKFGVAGFVIYLVGIYLTYSQLGSTAGNMALASSAIAGIILLLLTFRYISKNEVGLEDVLEGKVNEVDTNRISVGDVGIAFGDLRLSGRVDINNQIFDAESTGDYIEDGMKVMVVRLTLNQIFVKSVDDENYQGEA